MKKFLVLLLVMCVFFCSSAYAEKRTEFTFPEFSVQIADNYLTFTKENVEEVVGSNTMFDDLDSFSTFSNLILLCF